MTLAAQSIETPATIVARIYSESPDVATAANAVESEAKRNHELYCYLTEPYLARASYEAVRNQCRTERSQVWTAPNYTKGGNGHRVKNHARSLLDFPLPGGIRLRHATAAEVREAVDFYAKQANNMQSKSDWLSRIAEKLKGKKTVEQTFSAEQLAELR